MEDLRYYRNALKSYKWVSGRTGSYLLICKTAKLDKILQPRPEEVFDMTHAHTHTHTR